MGVYMANWNMYDEQGHCSGEQDYLDAEKAASLIGIPLRRVSFEKEYWTQVFRYCYIYFLRYDLLNFVGKCFSCIESYWQ